MHYLNRPAETLQAQSAIHTAREIDRQPELWQAIWQQFKMDRPVRDFLSPLFESEAPAIILTGAGSSDFIGKSVEHAFFLNARTPARAVSTTTLVTHFNHYIDTEQPLLLISFARSGNSPESVAVAELAETYCRDVRHLVITCNPEGKLALKMKDHERSRLFILPPEANDQSLAMTGSFTGMVLAALLLSDPGQKRFDDEVIDRSCSAARQLIDSDGPQLESLARLPFERAVFLGSGPLTGIARESHLKLQELTDGEVICKFDSFLGFRHGPKAVVNRKTLVVYLFSPENQSFRYERDLARQMEQEGSALETLALFSDADQAAQFDGGKKIVMNNLSGKCPDALIPLYVLPAQLLGFYKSLDLGLKPDNPSRSGSISRVVKGVEIYPDAKPE